MPKLSDSSIINYFRNIFIKSEYLAKILLNNFLTLSNGINTF